VTYLWLNLTVLLTLFVVLNVVMRKTPWKLIGYTALVMFAMTAIFDNLIIGTKIVEYDQSKISGIVIGLAPIEDFAYTLAAVVLVPALWRLFGRK
jgi:lycopene cyclase domain-containing protein